MYTEHIYATIGQNCNYFQMNVQQMFVKQNVLCFRGKKAKQSYIYFCLFVHLV